jgi:hypothetical protein
VVVVELRWTVVSSRGFLYCKIFFTLPFFADRCIFDKLKILNPDSCTTRITYFFSGRDAVARLLKD